MNKKTTFGLFGLFVLIAAVGVGIYLVRQRQDIRKKAAPATTLTLTSSQPTPSVGDSFNVQVSLDTSENQVVAVELYLNFDAQKLEVTGVTKGTFFDDPQEIGPTTNNSTGTLTYTLVLDPGSPPAQGEGVLATISVTAKAEGQANISFGTDTLVGGVGEQGQNVLNLTIPTSVTIQAATGDSGSSTDSTESDDDSGSSTNPPSPTPTGDPKGGIGATPTASASSTPTAPPLPESGVGTPATIGLGLGVLLLVFSLVLLL